MGTLAAASGDDVAAGPAFALGFSLVPVVIAVVAFVSGIENAPTATAKAMGIWLVLALPLGLVNPATGLSAGFGAAAAITLRRPDNHRARHRIIAVLINTLYVTVLVVIAPEAGLFAGAVTPVLAVRIADSWSERSPRVGGGV